MVAPNPLEQIAGTLRGSALRNWLRTDGAALIRSFETGVAALDYLRAGGVAIRTADFYAIRKEVNDVVNSAVRLENYAGDLLIPQKWHVSDHGLNLSTDYQYHVHLFGTDPETGLLKDRWMTVVSDRQLTKDDIFSMADAYLSEYEEVGDNAKVMADVTFGEVEALRR